MIIDNKYIPVIAGVEILVMAKDMAKRAKSLNLEITE